MSRAEAVHPTVELPTPDEVSSWSDRRTTAQATRAAKARSASGRRRHIDPATCDRDYSSRELEFMLAMQEYKKSSGRMFPTWSEVLEVLQELGYRKASHDAAPPSASASA